MGQEGSLPLRPGHRRRRSRLRQVSPPVCPRRRGTMIARSTGMTRRAHRKEFLKAARAIVLSAGVAALASLALAAPPGSAATPATLQILTVSDVRFGPPLSMSGRIVAEAEALPYGLGKTTALPRIESRGRAPHRGVGPETRANSGWSPGIPNWTGGDPRTVANFDRKRFNGQTLPLRMLGRRFVLSHFTVGRNRVHIMLSTGF